MALQVWLLRHGEAVPHGSRPDHQRELTERGAEQARAAGAALARLGVRPSACYASPKVRARDTARLACEPLGVEVVEAGEVAGAFGTDALRDLLSPHGTDERILVVGHEPDLSQLVHDLTGARVDVRKGGVAGVRYDHGRSELIAFLRPADLAAIAG